MGFSLGLVTRLTETPLQPFLGAMGEDERFEVNVFATVEGDKLFILVQH